MAVSRRDALLGIGASTAAAGLVAAGASAASADPAPSASPSTSSTPTASATPDPFPLRLSKLPLRDPWIAVDERTRTYHLFVANDAASSGVAGPGVMTSVSRDLAHWSTPTVVFQPAPDLWATHGGWAPEVHRWKGRWVLLVTLHATEKPLPLPKAGRYGIPVQIPQFQRGTIVAVSDSLSGPFVPLDPTGPATPRPFMALDGTLFADEHGKPWLVYAHEWVQKIDGTIEALPLKADLSGPAGRPVHLFKGSDASWISGEMPAPSANQILPYVTDGPELLRLPGGALAMLWSTYDKTTNNTNGLVTGAYVQTVAVSPSGKLKGPWVQKRPLIRGGGHGSVFRTLRDAKGRTKPMLVLHRGGRTTHARLYEVELRHDGVRLGKHRKDLDGS